MGNTELGKTIERTAKSVVESLADTLRNGVKSTPSVGYAKGGIINGDELKAQMEAAQGVGVMLEEWPSASWDGEGQESALPPLEGLKMPPFLDNKGVPFPSMKLGTIKPEMLRPFNAAPFMGAGIDAGNKDESAGIIKGLRLRSKAQGEKNTFLSLENAELKKHIKEIKLQKTRLMDDVGDYTKENRRLVDEVNKGNEYRAKMKETVESLHAQIRVAKENEKAATSAAVQTEIELERYKRITDALLDKGPF